MKIVLASASPRRKELLAQIGMEFDILVSDVEEKVNSSIPHAVVEELSAQKALASMEQLLKSPLSENVLVIGADTVVACEGQILGKPKDAANAQDMLRMLQGRSHEVYTGVTFIYCNAGTGDKQVRTFHEATKVTFYPMTEKEIADYVTSGDPLDKAGAYGIQGFCARYIKGIEGDYNNVVGLPVGRLYQELRSLVEA